MALAAREHNDRRSLSTIRTVSACLPRAVRKARKNGCGLAPLGPNLETPGSYPLCGMTRDNENRLRLARRARLQRLLWQALVSMLIGLAVGLLIATGRQDLLKPGFLLYMALVGLGIDLACYSLGRVCGRFLRGPRHAIVLSLVYFAGGCLGWLGATAVAAATSLLPFHYTWSDVWRALPISGGMGLVIGLVFYAFGRLRERLEQSVARVKEAEFAEKELELARSIQTRLLPPDRIEADGYRIAARNLAARYVAGDFYDVFRLAGGTVGIVVADVSGKGVGASLIMASVKSVMPILSVDRGVADTLRELNRKLCGELAPREFVALAYARYESASGEVEFANAGLPDPYLLRSEGGPETISVPGTRLPLGVRREVAYETVRLRLAPGDRFLLLTDGLPEARSEAGEPIGYEEFERLLPAAAATPSEYLDGLLARLRQRTGSVLEDDWTVLLLERRV
jgi:serine phosphatase RsbU (regulator of sigma subunit)